MSGCLTSRSCVAAVHLPRMAAQQFSPRIGRQSAPGRSAGGAGRTGNGARTWRREPRTLLKDCRDQGVSNAGLSRPSGCCRQPIRWPPNSRQRLPLPPHQPAMGTRRQRLSRCSANVFDAHRHKEPRTRAASGRPSDFLRQNRCRRGRIDVPFARALPQHWGESANVLPRPYPPHRAHADAVLHGPCDGTGGRSRAPFMAIRDGFAVSSACNPQPVQLVCHHSPSSRSTPFGARTGSRSGDDVSSCSRNTDASVPRSALRSASCPFARSSVTSSARSLAKLIST